MGCCASKHSKRKKKRRSRREEQQDDFSAIGSEVAGSQHLERRDVIASPTSPGGPLLREQSADNPLTIGTAEAEVLDGGESSPRRTTVFEDMYEEAEEGLEEFVMSLENTPEKFKDAKSIREVIVKATDIELGAWKLMYFPEPYKTKIRFRGIDEWVDEVGTMPAGVQSLVPTGSQVFRLTAKQLDTNQRLLMQLQQRIRKKAGVQSFGSSLDSEEQRKYSTATDRRRTSSNRVPDRNDSQKEFVLGEFFEELEAEQRRASELVSNGTSEDQDSTGRMY